eukprot:gnl/MRDRNA2_/MRDRNA2_70855_c0_seq1.p1 gnl/MRDRNA2_/MRDRNA2_70855_c0~~gnl/MRDRNA2_/MRDRNA2_70855_c0_seq1.p1  ORF type:complete len:220 (+),score=37.19 gnl/MRDRNA2_/MRDRNA2_70855_c0_seq1:105-764(+)
MLRKINVADLCKAGSVAQLDRANNLIATLRITKGYLVFCTLMSFLSLTLFASTVVKLAKHGPAGLTLRIDPREEIAELILCIGILLETLYSLRLLPLWLFFRTKVLQLDVVVFTMAAMSVMLASANLTEYALGEKGSDSEADEVWRTASSFLFLFRFILQPVRALLSTRNVLFLSAEHKAAWTDIVIPGLPDLERQASKPPTSPKSDPDHRSDDEAGII